MKRSQLGNIVDLLGVATVEEPTASKCEHGAQVNKATARSVLGCGCGKLNKQVINNCETFISDLRTSRVPSSKLPEAATAIMGVIKVGNVENSRM